MTRRQLPVLVAAASVILLFVAATQRKDSLPGAVSEIHAAQYASLQAALDAVPAGGGLVRLPAGEFPISRPLVIRQGDTTLLGSGSATHIKNINTEGLPAIRIAHEDHQRDGNNRNRELWRVRLADFRVTGNPDSGHGIVAHNVNEIFVDGVTISYHGGDGLKLSHCYEDPRIVDSLITYNKQTGVNLVGCHDIVVASNQFEENQDGLRCFDGFNLCMTGNCLDDHLGRGVVIENTYGSVVSGNMIEECQAAAMVMDRDCYGNTVSANVIAHNGAGIDLRDAHGCAISANTFTIMKTDALRIGPNSGRLAVSGNCFSDSYIGGGVHKRADNDRAAAGLAMDGSATGLVTGNAFTGIRPTAVRLTSDRAEQRALPSAISGNYFVETNPGVAATELETPVQANNFAVSSKP